MNTTKQHFEDMANCLMDAAVEEPQDQETISHIISSLQPFWRRQEIIAQIETRNGWHTQGAITNMTPDGGVTIKGIRIACVEITHIKYSPISTFMA